MNIATTSFTIASRIGTSFRSRYGNLRARRAGAGAGLVLHPTFRMSSCGRPEFPRSGSLEVRLARSPSEIAACQALRYRVFYEEMSAVADPVTAMTRRDFDEFDRFCDHLMVIDHSLTTNKIGRAGRTKPVRKDAHAVVGTYRLLRQEVADAHKGFYTAREFDISKMVAEQDSGMRFLELGRSCVLPPYRNKPTLGLLWQGIGAYIAHHNIDVMFGCASLEGTDPDALAVPLSFLYHHHGVPADWSPAWRVRGRGRYSVDMNILPKDEINLRTALRALPPLVKGYVRAGAMIGDSAVVDHQFGTTDVLIIFPVSLMDDRYASRFIGGIPATAQADVKSGQLVMERPN